MGKNKQAQRTKGNVKPSSSARAAELLASASSGAPSLGFVGFGTMSGDLGYVPAAAGAADDPDTAIDADFRMVLRKMSKRDATTKLKALQEMTSLCKDKDQDSVLSVLPFWPRIYSKMAIDHDRRVREATQQAQEQLVLRSRRNLAPHLRALMGPWLVAQSDLYGPAATAAKSAFMAAFPPAKQTEALVYCRQEIMQYINENLFIHTPQTLSDAKTTEPEDMESKYHRVISASFSALRAFILAVPIDQQESLKDNYRTMLGDGKFWKYSKHKQPTIVGAFYSVLSAFCQYHPSLASEFAEKLSPAVLHNLDCMEPLVCGPLWEAVLYVVSTVKTCWQHVSSRKAVLPRLWSVLKQGGDGSAHVIFPNLLPLLNHVPQDVVGDGIAFYNEFFSNIKTGLSLEKVESSPSECNAIVKAFMECLHFALSRNLGNEKLVACLIFEQLFVLLGSAVLQESPSLANTPVFSMTVGLVNYLYKLSSSDSTDSDIAVAAMGLILKSINDLGITQIDKRKPLERFALFLQCFGSPTKAQASANKKSVKVKFCDDSDTGDMPRDSNKAEELASSPLVVKNGPVFPIICNACKEAYQQSLSSRSLNSLVFFSHIFRAYASEDLLEVLWKERVPLHVLDSALISWIKGYALESGQEEAIQAFVDVLMAMFGLCKAEDQMEFMSNVMRLVPVVALFQHFAAAVACLPPSPAVRAWFRGAEFGYKMVDIARGLCAEARHIPTISACPALRADQPQNDSTQWQVLSLAFTVDDDLEPLLGVEYVSLILQEILSTLPSPATLSTLSPPQISQCVSFVCDVAQNFFSNVEGCLLLPPAEELLLALFKMSCQPHSLSDATSQKLSQTWQSGVLALVSQRGGLINDDGFFSKVTAHIRDKLLNITNCTMDRLQTLVSMTLSLARCVGRCLGDMGEKYPLAQPITQVLLQELCLPFLHSQLPKWEGKTIVSHHMMFVAVDTGMVDSSPPVYCPACVAPAAFTSQMLVASLTDQVAMDKEAVEEAEETGNRSALLVQEGGLLDLWYGFAFCRAMVSPDSEAYSTTDFGHIQRLLEEALKKIHELLPEATTKSVITKAFDKSMEKGGLWALCLHDLVTEVGKSKELGQLLEEADTFGRFSELTEPTLHTLQLLFSQLSNSAQKQLAEVHSALAMSCLTENLTAIQGARGHLHVLSSFVSNQDIVPADQEFKASESGYWDPTMMITVVEQIRTWREEQDDLFLFDSHVHSEHWPVVSFNIEVMHFLRCVVSKLSSYLSSEHWDFVLCSLVSWVQSSNESREDFIADLPTQAFAIASFDLLTEVARCISSGRLEKSRYAAEGLPQKLATEWTEFFSQAAYNLLLPLFVRLTEHNPSMDPVSSSGTGYQALLSSLSAAVAQCPPEHVKAHKLPAKLTVDDGTSNLPDSHQTVLNHLGPLLLSHSRAVQIAAYRLTDMLLPSLVQFDTTEEQLAPCQNADGDDAAVTVTEPACTIPSALLTRLRSLSDTIKYILREVHLEDNVLVEPHDNFYCFTVGYLLSWRLLLNYVKSCKDEVRAWHARCLRNDVATLVPILLRLMPATPLVHSNDTQSSNKQTQSMFGEEPLMNIKDAPSSKEVHHISCSVYSRVVQDLPAVLRQWYNNQDKRMAGLINRYTSKYVSPLLYTEELAAIQKSDTVLENMTVKTRPAAREVVATYSLEEISIELVVTLPTNHPLGPMTIDCGKRIGVANTQWRNWMLQLTTFLHKQNGTILDGLRLWKRNVDKRFEGVEECMICFSVIHGSNFQVPKLQCRTCKKRFHSACLYKWFNTSNNSTCPLCRNLF